MVSGLSWTPGCLLVLSFYLVIATRTVRGAVGGGTRARGFDDYGRGVVASLTMDPARRRIRGVDLGHRQFPCVVLDSSAPRAAVRDRRVALRPIRGTIANARSQPVHVFVGPFFRFVARLTQLFPVPFQRFSGVTTELSFARFSHQCTFLIDRNHLADRHRHPLLGLAAAVLPGYFFVPRGVRPLVLFVGSFDIFTGFAVGGVTDAL